ncbi:MAG: GNAT family N-acetyltransferase [Isosphaeraceae bacterium]|nr:GNAT family N-acetyltransferase [Isosphaeraceae bacterium]
MTHFRPFRNGDPPALAALWNRGVPARETARPLSAHEFDAQVANRVHFDAAGLIVAEREGRKVGFVHAGFGPEEPIGPPHRLNRALGTIGMLVTDPGLEDEELERGLVAEAERYLRERGAKVFYAGGQFPLNPFYWGLYGGSEWAGILPAHAAFVRAVTRAGYEPVSETVLMEADLTGAEARDPRSFLIRRATRVEVVDDPTPPNWWEALALGDFRPTVYRLLVKTEDVELARATTWDMSRFGRTDGRSRVGLIEMEVAGAHRRKGFGRHLVGEILRHARGEMTSVVALQTRATNVPALQLYQSLGFQRVGTSVLYRRPG